MKLHPSVAEYLNGKPLPARDPMRVPVIVQGSSRFCQPIPIREQIRSR
jgi:hypothetical protein